ncbi:MAG: hypothetical protein V3R39_03055 [Nitrosopumilus sp.]
MDNLESERLKHSPNVSSLLKISLGLILFTLLSSALVYADNISVDIEGNSFDIDYTTTGMSVSGIIADLDFVSLILTVDVTDSPGILEITFDRSFFDSTFKGADDDFIILADGDEPNFTETDTTTQSRTLSINLPSGTEEVEIIGSIFNNPAFEPEVTEPEVTEPEVTEPEVTEPEVTEETPKTQCGPGTVLEDGACVLDERCGPGTVLEDGVCVLESTSQSTPQSSSVSIPKGMGSELLIGTIAAFGIAAAIGIILALISRADTRKN